MKDHAGVDVDSPACENPRRSRPTWRSLPSKVAPVIAAGLVMISSSLPVRALTLTLGRIAEAGIVGTNAFHVALILERAEWDAVVSTNAGLTWTNASSSRLRSVLQPLPSSGNVRYLLADDESDWRGFNTCLVCSTNGGQAWYRSHPEAALAQARAAAVDRDRDEYLRAFGHWLPRDEAGRWSLCFSATSLALCAAGVSRMRRSGYPWGGPLLLTVSGCFLTGLCLYGIHHKVLYMYGTVPWITRTQTMYQMHANHPLWPMGVVLNLAGNAWFAPLTASICFAMTPLFWLLVSPCSTPSRIQHWLRWMALVSCAVLVLLIATMWIPEWGQR